MKMLSLVLVAALALVTLDADAKRLGGGKSFGKQSGNVTQRDAAPSPSSAPTQNINSATPKAAAPAAGAAAAKRPWGAMLGGLAAGLGLAWLANSLGFGEEFGQFMLMALLALVIMGVVGMIMRARRASGAAASSGGGYALQGVGAGNAPALAAVPRQYSPDNVGNDASARPWERNSMAFDAGKVPAATGASAGNGLQIGSALGGAQNWGIPAGFDSAGFVTAAKRNFVTLQDAWDRSDIQALRSMMTDSMIAEIQTQLAERESHNNGQPNKTDVVMLEANLLGIEEVGEGYVASVEFSGMIREQPSAGPSPFREVWNMTKPKTGGGWLVAGVQALQ
jgi:predicted lipid-binding transport protein (Tim44 family)